MVRWIAGTVFSLAVIFNLQDARGADPYEALSVLRIDPKPAPDFHCHRFLAEELDYPISGGKVVRLQPIKKKRHA